jgi:glycosyltransferase involved in cell wall biosynthesis
LPPARTGQGLVLYRLLEEWSPSDYCLVSAHDSRRGDAESRRYTLPGPTHVLGEPFGLKRGNRFGLARARAAVNVPLGAYARARQLELVVRREGCEAVVACTGDLLDLPAGCLAARRAGVPFYAYLFDHYSYREWGDPVKRFWARRLEPWLMRRAAAVIVPNEVLRDDLRERFGVEAAVIHNSFDVSPYRGPAAGPPAAGAGIVYTGDIYEAHYDAFRNLLEALERLGRDDLALHAYTPRTADELARHGLRGRMVLHAPCDPADVPGIQRAARLLFLPLAFKSPYPDLVRTSATTKMGEYMAARRPVLVHAPEGSFPSWYFREHRCGVVVDRDDPAALAEAISAVLADEDSQAEMAGRAWERVQADFRVESAREQFAAVLRRGGERRARAQGT